MHSNWINKMRSGKFLLIPIFLISILSLEANQVEAASFDDGRYEVAVKRAGSGWHNLQGVWGKRSDETALDYDDAKSNDYFELDPIRDYDTSKMKSDDDFWNYGDDKINMSKRSRPGNWGISRKPGWRKRQPGNWNNLRGLWGKRSSGKTLQSDWRR